MYVLVENDIVINGPRPWSFRAFQSTLREELDITVALPTAKSDGLPINIAEGVRILPVDITLPEYNPKIQFLHGPFWTFSSDVASGTYQVENLDIGTVKSNLKNIVAANRYNREIAGCTCVLQNITVSIDTTRDGRNIFVQKYLLMAENDTVEWKFPEAWLNITKAELGEVVQCGAAHIQDQFNWEASKVIEIDAATTLSELDAIVLE